MTASLPDRLRHEADAYDRGDDCEGITRLLREAADRLEVLTEWEIALHEMEARAERAEDLVKELEALEPYAGYDRGEDGC